MRLATFAIAVAVTAATPALAQHVEYVTKVKASPTAGLTMRAIGPRYITLSSVLYHEDAHVDVLDLSTLGVIKVKSTRTAVAKHFGFDDPNFAPDGELIHLDAKRAGFVLSDNVLVAPRRYWYAELDPKTGVLARSTSLGALPDTHAMYYAGTDVQQEAAWFYVERYAGGRGPDFKRSAGPKDVTFKRLDLKTLAFTDAAIVKLPARPMKNGYEDRLYVHHSGDFSRFAVVEYDEDDFKTTPPAKVHFVDAVNGTVFAVPALDTTYGVAFSRDGRHAFLASGQARKIARVDLARRTIDKTVPGPYLAHHAVISPNGSQLFVLATSTKVVTYDLPSLANRTEQAHAPGVIAAAAQLHGGGVASLDGTYFVVAEALAPGPRTTIGMGPPQEFVIARIVD